MRGAAATAPILSQRARGFGLPVAVVGAVLVAEAAVWLLRPDGVIEPLPVSESAYFSAAAAGARARLPGPAAPARPRRARAEGAVLVLLVARPPRAGARAGGAAGATAPARRRARSSGRAWWRSSRSRRCRSAHRTRARRRRRACDPELGRLGCGRREGRRHRAVLAGGRRRPVPRPDAALPAPLVAGGRGRRWSRSRCCSCGSARSCSDPLFNRYEELPPGRTRTWSRSWRERAGVDVGEVFVVDASRRTRGANAFVTGLGHTKRVVLYDTLIERFHRRRSAWWWRTSSATSSTATSRAACCGLRSSRPPGCTW